MNVVILCENSGKLRRRFQAKGHECISVDILPADDGETKHHVQMDALDFMTPARCFKTHLVIAHPPCTYLANSGVRWLYSDKSRWHKMEYARHFFSDIAKLPVPKICIENPIPHKYGVGKLFYKDFLTTKDKPYSQIIQPWQFGHGETKATCLWLKGLPLLKPTNVVSGREQRLHKLPPSKDRWKIRSETYDGIADAIVDQWG